jgi:uncharacterized protein (TIGR03435 family)
MLHKQQWVTMVLLAAAAGAQTVGPVFEVASVKVSAQSGGRYSMTGGPGTSDPGRIAYTNVMLRAVLLTAFDVKNYQLAGPDWLNTLRFDITARLPEGTTKPQFQAMLRNLLADRFGMVTHRESRELPIYALLPAKGSPKLKPAADAGAPNGKPMDFQPATVVKAEGSDGFPVVNLPMPGIVIETRDGRARISAKEVPMNKLADFLSGQTGRPVFDFTGLAGIYSFTVYFTPAAAAPEGDSDPSIFGALSEQLGLRLEARRGPVETVVVDRAEKAPTGN